MAQRDAVAAVDHDVRSVTDRLDHGVGVGLQVRRLRLRGDPGPPYPRSRRAGSTRRQYRPLSPAPWIRAKIVTSNGAEGRLDVVEVFTSVRGSYRVERAFRVARPQAIYRQGRHTGVGLLRDPQCQAGHLTGLDRVDQRARRVMIQSTSSGSVSDDVNGSARSSLSASDNTRASQNAMWPKIPATVQYSFTGG